MRGVRSEATDSRTAEDRRHNKTDERPREDGQAAGEWKSERPSLTKIEEDLSISLHHPKPSITLDVWNSSLPVEDSHHPIVQRSTLQCGVEAYGSTIYVITGYLEPAEMNVILCGQLCSGTSGCLSYQWQPGPNYCTLFNAPLATAYLPDSTANAYFYDLACSTPPTCNLEAYGLAQYQMTTSIVEINLSACQAFCVGQSGCLSYQWKPPLSECSTYNVAATTAALPASGVDAYFYDLECVCPFERLFLLI